MKLDVKELLTYAIAVLVLVGGWYSLVPFELELDKITQGAIIGFMGAAISFVFGQSIAKTTATATTKALMTPSPEQVTTVDAGPPMTITTGGNP